MCYKLLNRAIIKNLPGQVSKSKPPGLAMTEVGGQKCKVKQLVSLKAANERMNLKMDREYIEIIDRISLCVLPSGRLSVVSQWRIL